MLIMSYVQNKPKRKTFKRYFKNFQWYLCHHQFNFIEIWIFSKNCTLNFKDNGKLFLDFIWSVWWRNFNLNRVFHPLFKKGFLIEKGSKNTWNCQHHFHVMQIEKISQDFHLFLDLFCSRVIHFVTFSLRHVKF